MKILLVGSGGREHALARRLAASALTEELVIAPGNAGTASLGLNVPVKADDVAGLVELAFERGSDLVVAGPEAPLALGLADALAERSRATGRRVLCFGPSREAARLESSKAYAKETMARLGVPTARGASFTDFRAAAAYASAAAYPLVVKASGLASGKGVYLPASSAEAIGLVYGLLEGGLRGQAGTEVVLEERLEGEEVSVLAFCDGTRRALMPSAQDHKRLLDGDEGPNTGGMGAYAPAPACPPALAEEIARLAIDPILSDQAARGSPFVGILYAGVMLTADGPKILEYNCRFGDPEAQALLELFDGDLAATLAACAAGDIREAPPRWKEGAAACVVMASRGYPDAASEPVALSGLGPLGAAYVLHGATAEEPGRGLVSGSGRVLSVTAGGPDLASALQASYAKVAEVGFPGARHRRDIGSRGLARLGALHLREGAAPVQVTTARTGSAYAASGVDIDAGNEAVRLMASAVKATYTEAVLGGIGSFGGLYSAAALKGLAEPVLVASTDGVGTKVKLAAAAGSYRTIGMDIVNHCIDDILVQGARPLFFLDYFASSRLEPKIVAEAVGGMAEACAASGCALLGGETAEMPGVYRDGEFDVAGTIVGVVERSALLPRAGIAAGDVLVGLRSDSPHTNGYSLARKAFEGFDLGARRPELGESLNDALLRPHRSYLPVLLPVLEGRPGLVKGLAHITGGGFVENVPRILPAGLEAVVRRGSWPVPPLYRLMAEAAGASDEEMHRVFNMGIGMVAFVEPGRVDEFRAALNEESWVIGELARARPEANGTVAPARTRLA